MNVTREVILDLLPVYLAGEASAATRALVDEFLQQDAALGREVRDKVAASLTSIAPPGLPPELELKALSRTRGLLTRQQRVLAAAVFLSLVPLSGGFRFTHGRLESTWVLARDYPQFAVLSLMVAIGLWFVYAFGRRRLRTVV